MQVVNFFKRIGTVKHKYKVEFTIDKLEMAGDIAEEINVIVKRGNLRFIQAVTSRIRPWVSSAKGKSISRSVS